MKYNTIGCSSEEKKSTLTIYADLDIPNKNEDSSMESEVVKLKDELLQAQTALDKQTKRCRQLVGEFTRRLQEKESQYEHEKTLREDQLSKLLRALILVEARLKQEQKRITHQLREKDFIIQKQRNDLKKLLSGQYCKSCSRIYNSSANLESLDSSSEYIITDYQESNVGSPDSSSELYATLSDKDSSSNKSHLLDDSGSNATNSSDLNEKLRYQKNRGKDSLERKMRKPPQRKSSEVYFEVLKLRNDNASPYSNEDNTSNDYDNFDSLPAESVTDRMSVISKDSEISYLYESIEKIDNASNNDVDTAINMSLSESNVTVIHAPERSENTDVASEYTLDQSQSSNEKYRKDNKHTEHRLSDSIAVFDAEVEANDKWYVSASDQEDEQQENVYRNNPVLECVNQILLQNINDSLNSPPKTPTIERKTSKNKRVKFSDEKIMINEDRTLTQENLNVNNMNNEIHNYYETPVHKVPNFYESPQSIYSNDYEQILSRCSETFSPTPTVAKPLGQKEEMKPLDNNENINVFRKNKILRIPPALPPKPSNLLSKYKIQNDPTKLVSKLSDAISLDSEPDYCSISELNLPADRIAPKKIQVIAEINPSVPRDPEATTEAQHEYSQNNEYDDVENDEMIVKNIDKVNIQVAKQTTICSEESSPTQKSPSKLCQEIPKLPQVSEIIIPEDTDKEKEYIITQDNYVKNNSQMVKIRNSTPKRRPISMGSSVSSLIMGFNNRELMYELNNKKPTPPLNPPKVRSFENSQVKSLSLSPKSEPDNQSLNDYNLIQNFEEFKLDDCEIEEYIVPDSEGNENSEHINDSPSIFKSEESIELIRTVEGKGKSDEDISVPSLNRKSLELLKKHLQIQNVDNETKDNNKSMKNCNEPTYEHFLECTGLSSKSILTPSRIGTTHKTVLKPKDIKLRSRSKAYGLFDSKSISSGSEPFV